MAYKKIALPLSIALGASLMALVFPTSAFADPCPYSMRISSLGDAWFIEHVCPAGGTEFDRMTYTSDRDGTSLRLELSSLDYPD